ncbi:60S acidic ribosomal protein P2 [Geodia barretti]|uniref:Large ribosomal subunit protein P2 n=1 Tax=Geodia barretti TaxID=519541 RepID=A0AA35W3W9_GEOBA|nr:60S acidic ribosomal protein P2 [Geodia barretti]
MRYVAAYLLATLGGKSNPSKEDVENILESVGLDVDDEKLTKASPRVVGELDGKDINEVISEGMGKLASMPSGGAVAAVSAGGGGEGGAAAEQKEEAKEEKKEEEEDESDDDMGFGLFD